MQGDELRIIRILLSNTSLGIKIKGAKTTPFTSNIGSPQGDGISGPLFTIYFKNYLKIVRQQSENEPIYIPEINIKWIEQRNSCLPKEMIYADGSDFLTEDVRTKDAIEKIAPAILEAGNLLVKQSENRAYTTKKRYKN